MRRDITARVGWFVVTLAVSLVSTGIIAATVHPRWMKTVGDALIWGLMGSGLFLLAPLITGLAAVANRDAPIPGAVALLVVLLMLAGVVWAFISTVAVGL